MNTKVIVFALSSLLFACSSNKQNELNKLKDQREALSQKIENLEKEISATKTDSNSTEKYTLVSVENVAFQPFRHFIKVYGELDGDQNVSVFAQANGTVVARYADVGAMVKKGQVLAQIDDQQYQKQLQSLQTQYNMALDLFNKQQRLWDQKVGSEVQYLQAKTNKESLEQQIAATKDQLNNFKIKSPSDGTIEECNIKVGGMVTPSPQQVLYRVVAFGKLKVKADISEAYTSKVNQGDMLTINFPDINANATSRVDFVSKYISPVNRTFNIEASIDTKVPNLKANMVAILNINDYYKEKAIVVSQNIISSDADGTFVFVAKQNGNNIEAKKQSVVLGTTNNGLVEVISGLNPGDKLITLGYQDLVDGASIRY
ncbi:MAG TPA: efflux RND transporter periplasmic adaptor subunit [Williamwhitmania sp.]|nr:efflux RND transporter periplasmic adaptor subunit [Williamwhitmania sp.]